MALTRKFLSALGIEADKIDEIIEAHTETVNALKEERDGYKKDAEALPAVQRELDALKEKGEDPYKEQYETIKNEFDQYKQAVESEKKRVSQTNAYRKLLKDAGVSEKRIDSVMKVSKFDDLELDDNGEVKDSDKKIEAIKTEWADFIVEEGTRGADTDNPPAGSGDGDGAGTSRAAKVAAKYYENTYGGKKE